MAKWGLAVVGVVVLVLAWKVYSLMQAPAPTPTVTQAIDAGTNVATIFPDAWPAAVRRAHVTAPTDAAPAAPSPIMVDPKSPAFSDRVDIIIADKFRGHVADCYKGGDDPDKVIKIKYKLRIIGGLVQAIDVGVASSELDKKTEQCMLTAMRHASWRARDMPDFEEDQELFIRLRTLKKYRTRKKAR